MTENVEMIKVLDDENFADSIAAGVTLVDFYAEWCAPCKMLAPILAELAEKFQGNVTIAKVDIDHQQKVTSSHHVTSVPTLVLFKDGTEVDRVVGVRDADALELMINKAL
jgi:thioredoxin 1